MTPDDEADINYLIGYAHLLLQTKEQKVSSGHVGFAERMRELAENIEQRIKERYQQESRNSC